MYWLGGLLISISGTKILRILVKQWNHKPRSKSDMSKKCHFYLFLRSNEKWHFLLILSLDLDLWFDCFTKTESILVSHIENKISDPVQSLLSLLENFTNFHMRDLSGKNKIEQVRISYYYNLFSYFVLTFFLKNIYLFGSCGGLHNTHVYVWFFSDHILV